MGLKVVNARVVRPQGVLEHAAISIEDGKIVSINEGVNNYTSDGADVIEANGKVVMPGIIDLHTDAMDVEIIPRPGADFPIEVAFHELERKMAGCGITTTFHSMYMGYEAAEKNARSKYHREEVFERVYQCAQRATHINNKIHLRYELPGTYHYNLVLETVAKGYVDLLSVMDHTPGQGQVKPERFIQFKMRQEEISREAAEQLLAEEQSREKINGSKLIHLINCAKDRDIPVASHDDDSIEKVEQFFKMGVNISEFPINTAAAQRAKELGMWTVGGSSNILRGGSLSGNMDMIAGVEAGLIDAICSDYYPPSILHSIFKLHREGILSLHEAVNLATLNPAKTVGLDNSIGSLEEGKNADLIIVDNASSFPVVTHTIVNGNVSSQHQLQPLNEFV
ncbi:MAG: alpha-D-ribose 1-methylphosphonate 5-triphosphate diphosphatase [Bacteroidota bacterium]